MVEGVWAYLALGGQLEGVFGNFKNVQATKKASISQLASKAIALLRELLC
jgi:hypothetical protein